MFADVQGRAHFIFSTLPFPLVLYKLQFPLLTVKLNLTRKSWTVKKKKKTFQCLRPLLRPLNPSRSRLLRPLFVPLLLECPLLTWRLTSVSTACFRRRRNVLV